MLIISLSLNIVNSQFKWLWAYLCHINSCKTYFLYYFLTLSGKVTSNHWTLAQNLEDSKSQNSGVYQLYTPCMNVFGRMYVYYQCYSMKKYPAEVPHIFIVLILFVSVFCSYKTILYLFFYNKCIETYLILCLLFWFCALISHIIYMLLEHSGTVGNM